MSYTNEAYEFVYADLDAEQRRQWWLQQNGGQTLEPLPRPRLLREFQEACDIWYTWRQDANERGRRGVFNALLYRHGEDAVMRWKAHIDAVLDRVEADARNGAGHREGE